MITERVREDQCSIRVIKTTRLQITWIRKTILTYPERAR